MCRRRGQRDRFRRNAAYRTPFRVNPAVRAPDDEEYEYFGEYLDEPAVVNTQLAGVDTTSNMYSSGSLLSSEASFELDEQSVVSLVDWYGDARQFPIRYRPARTTGDRIRLRSSLRPVVFAIGLYWSGQKSSPTVTGTGRSFRLVTAGGDGDTVRDSQKNIPFRSPPLWMVFNTACTRLESERRGLPE